MTCHWSGFLDDQSALSHYRVGMGRYEGDDSVMAFTDVHVLKQYYQFSGKSALFCTTKTIRHAVTFFAPLDLSF